MMNNMKDIKLTTRDLGSFPKAFCEEGVAGYPYLFLRPAGLAP
jgi:hypothetical protein